jgi:hypothetical protein
MTELLMAKTINIITTDCQLFSFETNNNSTISQLIREINHKFKLNPGSNSLLFYNSKLISQNGEEPVPNLAEQEFLVFHPRPMDSYQTKFSIFESEKFHDLFSHVQSLPPFLKLKFEKIKNDEKFVSMIQNL